MENLGLMQSTQPNLGSTVGTQHQARSQGEEIASPNSENCKHFQVN